MGEEVIRLDQMKPTDRAGFTVMKAFMLDMFGEAYVSRVLQVNRVAFAKRGVMGWEPNDGNIVADVSPMRAPWEGQWGYRIRFCAWDGTGDIVINEFFVPSKMLPQFHNGDLSALN